MRNEKKKNHPSLNKLCYFKAGNVVDELRNSLSTSKEITGGPDYYVYSTTTTLNNKTKILYLSFGETKTSISANNRLARTIKTTKIRKYTGFHILELIALILKFKPTHILCVKRSWLHLIYIVSRFVGASFTISVHTDISPKNKINKVIMNHLFKRADSVVCHGPFLRAQTLRITSNTSKIIEYNASCKDLVALNQPLPVVADNIKNKKVISFVGRVEIRKGVHDLYEACKDLLTKNEGLVLCFAGKGPECERLANRAHRDGLIYKVIVLNQLSRAQIANLFKKTWLAVTPTKSQFPEGRCMAAMEALSMNIPVIAPNFGPFPYLVKNEVNGFLYRPDSVNELKNKIIMALEPETHNKLVQGTQNDSETLMKTNLSYGEAVLNVLHHQHSALQK